MPAPLPPREAPTATPSAADSQQRLMMLGGVLVLLLVFAFILLRFAS